ncbi:MAG TPA: cytochrome c3 family protein, partial [Thermoanaerobaculia bacterium]|nr:cytochrome c3 family protein [Thermoanaerobaculia bacterium]
LDNERQVIPWVRSRTPDGKETIYRSTEVTVSDDSLSRAFTRRMDCIDCHNRPTHIYVPPDRSIDRALLAGTIDRTLPFIKAQAVEALSKDYASTPQGIDGIASSLRGYYTAKYPAVYASKKPQVDAAVARVQDIFRNTRFPEMKVDWRTHPDNIGHFYFTGCFRCHDNQHVSKDGKVISKDCNICHSVLSQEQAGVVMADMPKNSFQHPVDLGDLTQFSCSDCHTGSAMAQ